MKKATEFSIIAFILVLAATAMFRNARSEDRTKGESVKVIIEVGEVTKRILSNDL